MYKKLILEGLVALAMLSQCPKAYGSDLQRMITIEPSTYTINAKIEPLKGLQFVCSTSYIQTKGNGICTMDYHKDIGIGRLEVKGYKPLTDKGFYIGMKYKIEW